LVLLDVDLAEIRQRHAVLRKPTVERHCVPYLDVDDARRVLLINQRCDERAKMSCQWTSGPAGERHRALIRRFHNSLLVAGSRA
jgi:hypothetical protein